MPRKLKKNRKQNPEGNYNQYYETRMIIIERFHLQKKMAGRKVGKLELLSIRKRETVALYAKPVFPFVIY